MVQIILCMFSGGKGMEINLIFFLMQLCLFFLFFFRYAFVETNTTRRVIRFRIVKSDKLDEKIQIDSRTLGDCNV